MAASPDRPSALRPRAAVVLWRAAATVLSFLPVGMAVAHRSSPLFLAVAAVLAVMALGLEQGWASLARALARSLDTALGRAVLAFLAWSVASLAWSEFPAVSVPALLEFWIPVACALVLSLILPARVPRWGVWFLTGTLALACVAVLVELWTGLALHRAAGMRSHTFIFNRTVLTVLVILVPVVAGLRLHGRGGGVAAAGLVGLAFWAIGRSESGAAALGAAVAVATGAAALAAPRWTLSLAALAAVVAVSVAPVLGPIADRLIPPEVHTRLADSHSRDRIDIWHSFGAAVREQPWIGFGFGVSPRMGDSTAARAVAPERRELLAVGHPHNAAVQIWTELGLVGAALAALILLLVLRALAALPRADIVPALALMAAVAAVSLVGHGAWQGWWPAAIGTAIVWVRFVSHLARGRA